MSHTSVLFVRRAASHGLRFVSVCVGGSWVRGDRGQCQAGRLAEQTTRELKTLINPGRRPVVACRDQRRVSNGRAWSYPMLV
jgi:hypothetical protein